MNTETRLKTPLFRLFLLVAIAALAVLTVDDAWVGAWAQLPIDALLLMLPLVSLGALRVLGYRWTTVLFCLGFSILMDVYLISLGYRTEHSLFVVVLVLVVVLAFSTLFLDSFPLLVGLFTFESAFLAVHTVLGLNNSTTRYLSLEQQLFVPLVSYLVFSAITLLSRRYMDRVLAEHRAVEEELRSRHRSLGQMIRGLSHHLNTPLGNARVLLSAPLSDEGRCVDDEILNLLRSSVEVSVDLLGRMGSFLRYTDEAELSRQGGSALAEYLAYSTSVPAETRPTEGFLRYYARPRPHHWEALRFVVAELVDNARLHSRVANVVPVLDLDVREGTVLVLTVQSPGTFVGPEVLAQGTLPFFSTLVSADHPGLGLYFADYIVEHVLGGHLTWASDQAEGTKVTLRLPGERTESAT